MNITTNLIERAISIFHLQIVLLFKYLELYDVYKLQENLHWSDKSVLNYEELLKICSNQ